MYSCIRRDRLVYSVVCWKVVKGIISKNKRSEVRMSKEAVVINEISDILKNIQYGSIIITIHEGQVTQIDTTVKKRLQTLKKQATK